jgi:hypothetical protein
MEVHDYNMLVQNHVHYNYVVQKLTYGVVVQWLKTWFFNVKVKNSSPQICNLGYLCDLIKELKLQSLLDHLT